MNEIKGYTPLTAMQVAAVNNNKEMEETILRMLDAFRHYETIDQRWLAIGRTHFEQGFMAINRSIMKPERIKLSTDKKADMVSSMTGEPPKDKGDEIVPHDVIVGSIAGQKTAIRRADGDPLHDAVEHDVIVNPDGTRTEVRKDINPDSDVPTTDPVTPDGRETGEDASEEISRRT